jgi:hypothetical protein
MEVSLAHVVVRQQLRRNDSLEMRTAVLKTSVALGDAQRDYQGVKDQPCFSNRMR